MNYRVALVIACVAVMTSGCAPLPPATPAVSQRIDVGDSGTGTSQADAVYRVLGSTDGRWVERGDEYDPVQQLDIAVRAASAQGTDDMPAFEPVDSDTAREEDAVVQTWRFPDGSELVYRSRFDDPGDRIRIESIRVTRPEAGDG